jgi:drug/metabolite transporter (DMT)-like permease
MRLHPVVVVAAGVVFTSFSAIFIRLSSAPPLIVAAYRMTFTTLLVLPLLGRELIARARSTGPGGQSEPPGEPRPGRRRAVLLSILSGVFLSLHFAAWNISLSLTSVASATVLVTTHPIIVAVVGFLILGERLSWRATIFMLAALAGSGFLVLGGTGAGGSVPLGNLLAFLGAVAVSGYMIIGRVARQELSANQYTAVVYSVAAVLLIIYAVIAGDPLFGYAGRDILLFLALAVVCTLLGHSLFNWALRFVRPTIISTSILGEPVIASSLAVGIFGEVPTAATLAGGAVILVSIFLFVREEGRMRRESRSGAAVDG